MTDCKQYSTGLRPITVSDCAYMRENINSLPPSGHRYRVVRHGLRRDDEQLSLYFKLARDTSQPDMSEALKRPMAEERDDSEFYHRIGGGLVVDSDRTG